MPETVGSAQYELGVSMTKLKSGLSDAEASIKKSGATAEAAFGRQGTAAANKMAAAQGVLVKQGAELKKGILAGVGIGGGLVAFSALTSVVSGVAGAMVDAVHAAAEEQAQIDQLTQAIRANDAAWDGNIDRVEAVITQRQDLAFADNELRDSLQALTLITKDVDEALALQTTAMDLARAKNMDLTKASEMLGKVYAGNFTSVRKLGIILDDTATSTDYLREIQKRAAGQADAYAGKSLGKLERAQIAADNAMEDFGTTLLPVSDMLSDLAISTLPLIGKFFQDLGPSLRDATIAIPELFTTIGEEAQKLEALIGRDLVNDFFNFTRIVATGGTALVVDSMDDVQRAAMRASEGTDIFAAGVADDLYLIHGVAGEAKDVLDDTFDEAAADAEALGKAVDHVASESFPELKDAAKEAQKAIRLAADTNPMAALRREEQQLARQRRRYAREGEVDAVAVIDARQKVIDAYQRDFRTTKRGLADERKDRKAQKDDLADVQGALDDIGATDAKPSVTVTGLARARAGLIEFLAMVSQVNRAAGTYDTYDPLSSIRVPRHRGPADAGDVNHPSLNRGRRKDGAMGAVYNPGDWGYVGEHAMERIRNVGGVTTVEPIAGGSRAPSSIVVNVNAGAYLGRPSDAQLFAQSVAPAIGRELQRLGM